jgi:hypothetical protein
VTLSEATQKGYKILSGPYRIPHQEGMMLAATESLGSTEHKVVSSGQAWYIVRLHMVDVEPETEIPEARNVPRTKVWIRLSDEAHGLLLDFTASACKGNFSQAVEIAVLGYFNVKKVKKSPKCLPSTTPVPMM